MTLSKKLKLIEAFDKTKQGGRSAEQQTGYEKVDDQRVVERFFHPLLWQRSEQQLAIQQMTVVLYDFKSFTASVSQMFVDRNLSIQGDVKTSTVPFSAFENKQALREAFRALKELGGDPTPFEDRAFTMSTETELAAPPRATFKPKAPPPSSP